jgi:hypothetical protein
VKKSLLLLLAIAAIWTCKSSTTSPEAPKTANVVMLEGPNFEDGYSIFWYKGRAQNKGTAAASYAKVYIYIRKTDSSLIAQEWTYLDDTDLQPGETTPFEVLFSDDDHSIRDHMDKSKTTSEFKWD